MNSMLSKTILIIEDEEPLLASLVDLFKIEGYRVERAKNGVLGLELAREKHPDVILLDVILPKMHGIKLLKELRADERGKNIPVILLTNLSKEDALNVAATMQEDLDTAITKELKEGTTMLYVKSETCITDIFERVKKILGT